MTWSESNFLLWQSKYCFGVLNLWHNLQRGQRKEQKQKRSVCVATTVQWESFDKKKQVLQKWSLTVGVCRECVEGEREEEKQNDDDEDE